MNVSQRVPTCPGHAHCYMDMSPTPYGGEWGHVH